MFNNDEPTLIINYSVHSVIHKENLIFSVTCVKLYNLKH